MYSQGILQILINLHNRSLITTPVAVIRRTEDGNHIPILTPIVPLHDQLMGSCDQCKSVVVVERFRDILAEGVSRASG